MRVATWGTWNRQKIAGRVNSPYDGNPIGDGWEDVHELLMYMDNN